MASVSGEDIRGYVDGETWDALVEGGLVEDAVDFAAGYMQKHLDQVGFFAEMRAEGAQAALR